MLIIYKITILSLNIFDIGLKLKKLLSGSMLVPVMKLLKAEREFNDIKLNSDFNID